MRKEKELVKVVAARAVSRYRVGNVYEIELTDRVQSLIDKGLLRNVTPPREKEEVDTKTVNRDGNYITVSKRRQVTETDAELKARVMLEIAAEEAQEEE